MEVGLVTTNIQVGVGMLTVMVAHHFGSVLKVLS